MPACAVIGDRLGRLIPFSSRSSYRRRGDLVSAEMEICCPLRRKSRPDEERDSVTLHLEPQGRADLDPPHEDRCIRSLTEPSDWSVETAGQAVQLVFCHLECRAVGHCPHHRPRVRPTSAGLPARLSWATCLHGYRFRNCRPAPRKMPVLVERRLAPEIRRRWFDPPQHGPGGQDHRDRPIPPRARRACRAAPLPDPVSPIRERHQCPKRSPLGPGRRGGAPAVGVMCPWRCPERAAEPTRREWSARGDVDAGECSARWCRRSITWL